MYIEREIYRYMYVCMYIYIYVHAVQLRDEPGSRRLPNAGGPAEQSCLRTSLLLYAFLYVYIYI